MRERSTGTTLTRSSGWAESTNNEPPAALDARGRGLWRRRERQAERVPPEGKLWRQAFELNKPFLFIIGVRGGRFGGLVYPLILWLCGPQKRNQHEKFTGQGGHRDAKKLHPGKKDPLRGHIPGRGHLPRDGSGARSARKVTGGRRAGTKPPACAADSARCWPILTRTAFT